MIQEVDPNEDFNGNAKAPEVVEPPKEIATRQETRPAPLKADERGLLTGSTLEDQFRLARMYLASGLMPKGLNSPEKIMVAMQVCRELNLPPMTSVRQVMVFNGVPAIFGDLPIGLVHRSGLAEYIDESFEDKDGQPFAAVCKTKRKGSSVVTERRFTMDDAKKAQLISKEPWQKYPRRMLQCRARAWALKDAYADVLSGVAIAEYDFDATADESGNPVGVHNVADELNQKFLEKKD